MRKYRVKLPDGTINNFENEDEAINFAKSNSIRLKKVISVDYTDDDFKWFTLAIAYPNGKVQVGTGGFGFFKH